MDQSTPAPLPAEPERAAIRRALGAWTEDATVDDDPLGFDPSLDEIQTPYQLTGSP